MDLKKPSNALAMNKAINENEQLEIEAAVFHRLVKHLGEHPDVQNIDLMILADFCRNCLAKWYQQAAKDRSIEIDYNAAREIVYGMPYSQWKETHQKEATPEQLQAYEKVKSRREAKQ